jgi:glycerophosphoryl diester phosphodiesterase
MIETHKNKYLGVELHRGAGIHSAHNTIKAFKFAIESKIANYIELDVWLSKD